LQSAILRRLKRTDEALAIASDTVARDPLDFLARFELLLLQSQDPESIRQQFAQQTCKDRQLHLDLAFDYAAAGLFAEALAVLSGAVSDPSTSTYPMVYYSLAHLAVQTGDQDLAAKYRTLAAAASPDYCFPSRLEEMRILEETLNRIPSDAKGQYYLGNLYYDKKRYEDAISRWEKSVEVDAGFSIPWRNLGVAYFNVRHDPERALCAYESALIANPQDARLVYELDQLRKRTGFLPRERLAFLEKRADLVAQRDDLVVELVTLYNQSGEPRKALEILLGRRFHPWEGGEGLVSGQYVWAHRLLGISCLNGGDFAGALEHFNAARTYPHNLGEGKHFLTQEVDIDYYAGIVLRELGRDEVARTSFTSAADADPGSPLMTYYKALALRSLGRTSSAVELLQEMKQRLDTQRKTEPKIDYFATSLPNFLLFEDDLVLRNEIESTFSEALVELGLGNDSLAAEKLRLVLDRDPNNLAAQMTLAQISRAGDSVVESTSGLAR
jgi:tetratricopeptide (TPR) repeat protein